MPVEVKSLSHTYNRGLPTEFKALTDISFEAEDGAVLSIVGHTGSGKSTLAYHLNGLLVPQSGGVSVNGLKVTDDPKVLRKVRSMVGLVFQYPEQQIFAETVEEELSFAPLNWGIKGNELKRRVTLAMDAMGLGEDMLSRSPFELSGGQKRRLAIASVLSSDPYCLVLDEPTAGLDSRGTRELVSLVDRFKKRGKCIIHITHDIDLALRTSDKIVILNGGGLFAFGTASEIAHKLCETEVRGLRMPEILALSKELRALGVIGDIAWEPRVLADMIERGR